MFNEYFYVTGYDNPFAVAIINLNKEKFNVIVFHCKIASTEM